MNRRDYRAWYGLGQTYEVLKLPAYCIYYYKQVRGRSVGCWWGGELAHRLPVCVVKGDGRR